MKWTKELPTQEGMYFFRGPRMKRRVVEVYVEPYDGHLMAKGVNIFHEVSRLPPECQWAGPIPEPEEPGTLEK